MATTPTIPKIAVTHDEGSIEDESNYLTLTEALTDIEDLDEEEGGSLINKIHKKERRSKLKIKIHHDGALTDYEDFEGSDEEDDKIIIRHSKPISLDDLDLEGGTFEESYKTQVKTPKGKRKLKTQSSTSHMKSSGVDYKIFENYTDEELFDTDNEILRDSITETDVDLDLYNVENLNVSDKTNKSGFISPSLSSKINQSDSEDSDSLIPNSKQFLSALSPSPNLSDLTDIEVLSDSDNEKSFKKVKSRRRRHRGVGKASVTDVEDLDVSDDDAKFVSYIKPKRRVESIKMRSQSLLYDSDNEENVYLPFPICKKIAEKKENILNIPEFDTNFTTDVEDFDVSENIVTPNDSNDEDGAFEEKLDDVATGYSNINEAHSSVKNKSVCRTLSAKTDDTLDDLNDTDSDICQTENGDKENDKEEEESVAYDIKFAGIPSTKVKQTNSTFNLVIPAQTEDPITDCENIDTSDEEYSKTIPLALAKQGISLTDEEEFEDDYDHINNFPELILPPAVRNLVIYKDNDSVPTIQILPLVEETPVQSPDQSVHMETDEENISEAEEAMEGVISVSISDFNVLDCGVINESENIQNKPKKLQKEDGDALTDTEEIVLNTRRRRAPKFKHMHERFVAEKNKLTVKNDASKVLTDTEDLVLSDANSEEFHSLSPLLNIPDGTAEGLTDIEVLGDTTDDEKDNTNIRESSCTPQHMREMGGSSVRNMEGSGSFSVQDHIQVNKPVKMFNNVAVTPVHTDTEDLVGSADEDNISYSRAGTVTPNDIHMELNRSSSSKILSENKSKMGSEGCMYLKGGGYFERLTDVEYISEEEERFKQGLDSVGLLNVRDGTVCFRGEQEWEASRQSQPLLEPTAPPLVRDAAQKGGDQIQSTSSVRETTSSSTRPEGEEGAEKEESGYESRVADQHQLSEEMKELLKELERESKQ